MRRLFLAGLFLATGLLSPLKAQADLSPLEITEEDASPSTFPYQVKFTNGTVTDNGDGTTSVSSGGGSGTPASPQGSNQFNKNGSFGGSARWVFNEADDRVMVSGAIVVAGSVDVADGAITLNTETQGNYVASVADGTGIDGTASAEAATYTPTLDLTELTTATWGVNNFTNLAFSTAADDFEWAFAGSNAYFVNTTDGKISFIHRSDDSVGIGEVGSEPSYISFSPATAGDNGIKMPPNSINPQELDAIDEPTDAEVYSYDAPTQRGEWISAGGGSAPGGSGTELQVRAGASTFGAVTNSSSSGADITLVGSVNISGASGQLDFIPASGDTWHTYVGNGYQTYTDKTTGLEFMRFEKLNSRVFFPQASVVIGNGGTSSTTLTQSSDTLTVTPSNSGGVTFSNSITVGGTGQSTLTEGLVINNGGTAPAASDFQVKGDTDNNTLYVDASADNVGIGTATPSTKLSILGPDNGVAETITINATQANVTTADTFIDFRSTSGSEGTIAGTAGAGVLIFNTFTGSHYTLVEPDPELKPGMILEAVGGKMDKLNATRGKRQLVTTRLCRTRASPAAFGVYGGRDNEGRDMCLSIGTGMIIVANKGTPVNVGDFLVSSDVAGYAELQGDDVYRNSTVAKAMELVTWEPGEKEREIACVYLGG